MMKLNIAYLLVFTVLWLLPFYLTGAMIKFSNPIYSRLRFQYSAAGLFTHRISSWNQTLFQVRTIGVAEWKTIITSEISPMGAFGFRQRLDRILLDTSGKKTTDQVRLRLAEWVAKEYAQKHPQEGDVVGVRMGYTTWAANTPQMAAPASEWVREPVDMQPTSPFRAYASFSISKGKAVIEHAAVTPKPTVLAKTPEAFYRKKDLSGANALEVER